MKKVASLFLALLLLGTFAFAEVDFDVNDYTEDELIDIMREIHDADTQLGYMYSNDILLVGEDIPAGRYEFWVGESDISYSARYIAEPLTYFCGASTLLYIGWGSSPNDYENTEAIYYNQYNERVQVSLEEGQFLGTGAGLAGANYIGLHMQYFPHRNSGLFSE